MDNPVTSRHSSFCQSPGPLGALDDLFRGLTLLLELALPFLIWYPGGAGWMMSGSFLLHLGIGIFMGLKVFSILMVLFVSSFMPPEVTEWIRQQWSGAWGWSEPGQLPSWFQKSSNSVA